MGLDMYLYKETYVKNWDWKDSRWDPSVSRSNGSTSIKPERIIGIIEEIGYWRKFNALHNWFVQNCAGGVDECQRIYLYDDNFDLLLENLLSIQGDPSAAQEALPTTSGFFFGGTQYDEWYFDEVARTIEIIKTCIQEKKSEDYPSFYYQASW